MLSLPPPSPLAKDLTEFRERVRYEAAGLQVQVGNAIATGSEIRGALKSWTEKLAGDFRILIELPPIFGTLPDNLADYESDDIFVVLRDMWHCEAGGERNTQRIPAD